MRALWHINEHSSEIREQIISAQNELVQLNAKFSLISMGTERLVAKGLVSEDFAEQMSVPFMDGHFSLPIKYGYSMIAEVEDGRLAHLMHPHQDEISIAEKCLYYLPQNLPADRATLISNMETIINAIWDGAPQQHEKIAICGFGGIGALLALTLRLHYNIEVDIVELDSWRLNKATEMGWTANSQFDSEDYDLIYHTTASSSGLQACIDHSGMEARVVELSWYGEKETNLSLGKKFHYRRLQILSSQVGVIPTAYKSKFDYKTRKDLSVKYLQHENYDQLITGTIPFTEAPVFYKNLRIQLPEGLIWLIKY